MDVQPARTFDDLAAFARAHVASDDIDPAYPVLRALYKRLGLGMEQRLWFTALYLGFYNLCSALEAFRAVPEPGPIPAQIAFLPCATERRGLRGGKVAPHLASYLELTRAAGSQQAFITQGWGDDPVANYLAFWDTAQLVKWNGRWAAFKWGEILKDVHALPLAAPDMRLEFCSGPKEGLCWLYGEPESAPVERLNEHASYLMAFMREHHRVALDWEGLETVLCDFNSMRKGHYYVGHDIDLMQLQIVRSTLSGDDKALLFSIRSEVFPWKYLGELQGWEGADKERNRVYEQRGLVLTREDDYGRA